MKILYVSQFYYPERAAGALRATDNSKIWSNLNHNITVFTTYPNFPTGEIFEGYSNKIISKQTKDNINIIRNKIIPMKNTSKFNRAISSASFLFFSIFNIIFNKKYLENDYDIVLGSSGTILAPIIAYIYSLRYKTNFVVEFRDITYNQLLAVYGKKNVLYFIIKKLELFFCNKADKVVVVTKGFKSILVNDGIYEEKIEVIPNGAFLDKTNKQIDIDIIKNKKDKIVFSYIGNIGGSQNLKRVIDTFNYLDIKNKELLIIGDGGKKDTIKKYIKDRNIKNINLMDGIEYSKLKEYYQKSDFCIVSLNNNEKFIETIPSKIFNIMSHRKPILYLGPKGEASNIIEEARCGLIYTSHNYKEIANQISELINSYIKSDSLNSIINSYGSLGYEYVIKNYNREELAKKYIEVFEEVIEKEVIEKCATNL